MQLLVAKCLYRFIVNIDDSIEFNFLAALGFSSSYVSITMQGRDAKVLYCLLALISFLTLGFVYSVSFSANEI